MPTRANPSPASDEQVRALLERYKCPVPFHEVRTRFAAARIAWCLAAGEWPSGVVRARNGVDDDLSFDNLIATMRGPRPFTMGAGGKASSLERRSAADRAMLAALAEHQGSLTE